MKNSAQTRSMWQRVTVDDVDYLSFATYQNNVKHGTEELWKNETELHEIRVWENGVLVETKKQ